MTKPRQTHNATELSLLIAMVCYVHSVVLLCHPLLSYHSTFAVAFASMPFFFFIISNCLEMEKSFPNLYWNHFLFVAAHLTTACESNYNQDLANGYLTFFLGTLFLSFYAIYIFIYQNLVGLKKVEDYDDKSENNGVPLLIEISVSFIGNGIALIGRWFIPRDRFLSLMAGAAFLFSIGVLFFCYFLFSSAKSGPHDRLILESDNSVN